MARYRNFNRNFTDKGYLLNYSMEGGRSKAAKTQVLQFRVELLGSNPLIWRRIQAPINYNFWELHVAIQDAMGWDDCHLHYFAFVKKGSKKPIYIGIPDFEQLDPEMDIWPGWEIHVHEYFTDLGTEASYVYDYGDDWMHRVILEGHLLREEDVSYPRCVGGEMACPPENCGGLHAYGEMMEMFRKGKAVKIQDLFTGEVVAWQADKFEATQCHFDFPYTRWIEAFLKR